MIRRQYQQYIATVIAEFDRSSDDVFNAINLLSDYLSDICLNSDSISIEIQSHPAGYRLTAKIHYKISFFKRTNYYKKLAKVSKWITKDTYKTLTKYHYNITT